MDILSTIGSLLPLALVIALVWGGIAWQRRRRRSAPPPPPGSPELYGVGGWLQWFIVASATLGPLLTVGSLMNNLGAVTTANPALVGFGPWQNYSLAAWGLTAGSIAWIWWVCYKLTNKFEARSAFHAKLMLATCPLLLAVGDISFAWGFLEIEPNGDMVQPYLTSAAQSGVWLLYFCFSKRVKNTYYSGRVTPAPLLAEPYPSESLVALRTAGQRLPSSDSQVLAEQPALSPRAASVDAQPDSLEQRMETLKRMADRGLITVDEFDAKKAKLLASL